jgi:hypothetical protein
MEEPPPQDDDPNFSALNPIRSPLLSRNLIFEGLFFKNWGWARGQLSLIFPRQRSRIGPKNEPMDFG